MTKSLQCARSALIYLQRYIGPDRELLTIVILNWALKEYCYTNPEA